MILTRRTGQEIDVPVEAIEPHLERFLAAADAACGASTTAPEVENLRRAREVFMKALDRLADAGAEEQEVSASV